MAYNGYQHGEKHLAASTWQRMAAYRQWRNINGSVKASAMAKQAMALHNGSGVSKEKHGGIWRKEGVMAAAAICGVPAWRISAVA